MKENHAISWKLLKKIWNTTTLAVMKNDEKLRTMTKKA